jgi:hypothetical protein
MIFLASKRGLGRQILANFAFFSGFLVGAVFALMLESETFTFKGMIQCQMKL